MKRTTHGARYNNVLFLEKMGCDFWKDEPAVSDVGNYRVRTHGEVIPGKDGKMYFLEFSMWRNRKKIRYTHKITGKPLKHPALDVINRNGVALATQYTNEKGCWRNCTLEKEISEKNYSFTKEDILKIANEISTITYNQIIFAPAEAIVMIPQILKIAGYRERDILEHLAEVTRVRADKDYIVYHFCSDSDYFEYEYKSGRITG